jgi:hypothetical protein
MSDHDAFEERGQRAAPAHISFTDHATRMQVET